MGTINVADRRLSIGRGLAAIRSARRKPWLLFHLLRQAKDQWAPFNTEGTVFGSINRQQIERVTLPDLGSDEAQNLESVLGPLESRLAAAEAESRQLATLRDTLLPHLMSGRITVGEAEVAVSGSV